MSLKTVFETLVTDTWLAGSNAGQADQVGDKIGDLRIKGGIFYKCVVLHNVTGTVAVVDGDVVNYLADTGPALHQVVADVDDAGTQRMCAGVVLATMAGTLAVEYFCWVQLTGLKRLAQTIGDSAGDGDPLTTDGAADKAMDKAATIESRWAVCVDQSDKDVILNCAF